MGESNPSVEETTGQSFDTDSEVIIVSGLPRSGTSMMMRMLSAAGIEQVVDNIRTPDEDNPKGYFEFEKVKQLDKENAWILSSTGKGVKVISMLLYHLPQKVNYRIVFMERKMSEVLASQRRMLERRGEKVPDPKTDVIMAEKFGIHLNKIKKWINQQPNMAVHYIRYNEVVEDPYAHAEAVSRFLGMDLDAQQMGKAVDRSLYRQRG